MVRLDYLLELQREQEGGVNNFQVESLGNRELVVFSTVVMNENWGEGLEGKLVSSMFSLSCQ